MTACFNLLNLTWFENLQTQVDNCQTAEELQELVDKAYSEIALLQSTLNAQLAILGPVEALLTAPTDLASAITWVGNFITDVLTPYVKPLVTMAAQVTAVEAQIAAITAEVESIAASKFPGVTITIPSIDPFCTL